MSLLLLYCGCTVYIATTTITAENTKTPPASALQRTGTKYAILCTPYDHFGRKSGILLVSYLYIKQRYSSCRYNERELIDVTVVRRVCASTGGTLV